MRLPFHTKWKLVTDLLYSPVVPLVLFGPIVLSIQFFPAALSGLAFHGIQTDTADKHKGSDYWS